MDQKELKKRKMIRRGFILAMVFMLLWVLASVVNAFFPKRSVSVSERRALARFPRISIGRLLDGRFEADFEEYAKDQIMGRRTGRPRCRHFPRGGKCTLVRRVDRS